MKLKRKYLIIAAIAVPLAVLTGFVVFAGSGGGWFCGGGFHPGHGRGFHRGFSNGGFADHMLEHMDHKVEHLNLSDSQMEQYEQLKLKVRDQLEEGAEKRRALFTEVKDEMEQENPDIEKIAGLLKGKIREMPAFMESHIDLFIEFYNILDNDQKALMVERFKEKMGRKGDW
jgi:Spy/CpxP family protein refolding chaperone